MSSTPPTTQPTASNWWMFHGDPAHTGEVTDSSINSSTVKNLKNTFSIDVPGSILSTPAVVDGYIYVGLANSQTGGVPTANGGTVLKVNIDTGVTEKQFDWVIDVNERDSHGFSGMGCTPAVVNGFVYFIAFNGVLYCLNAGDMTLVWETNLRWEDPAHNQPVRNVRNYGATPPTPQASGWSSPVVANGNIWVGIGEGENPNLMAFLYCLDATTGNVKWIFCTCKYSASADNQPNVLPAAFVVGTANPPFTLTSDIPEYLGCSIWSGIAYDPDLDMIYASTGNGVSSAADVDPGLPTPNSYACGLLALKASTGAFVKFTQFPPESSYRVTDLDIDVGGSPTLYTMNGRKVVGLACKNGAYMICDAQTIETITWRQMLPKMQNGDQIPTVDPHGPDTSADPYPSQSNEQSNTPGNSSWSYENYQGTYSTAAICSSQQKLFVGSGGNNYHFLAPGIDTPNTPFIRAMDWTTLDDAWPTAGDPLKYTNGVPPLYTNATESGIGVPAVVNDVVFMATTFVALYAFSAKDGTLLWKDDQNFGSQTGGFMGGYGYCIGPAIWGNYVVAGALVAGGKAGGALNIYKLS